MFCHTSALFTRWPRVTSTSWSVSDWTMIPFSALMPLISSARSCIYARSFLLPTRSIRMARLSAPGAHLLPGLSACCITQIFLPTFGNMLSRLRSTSTTALPALAPLPRLRSSLANRRSSHMFVCLAAQPSLISPLRAVARWILPLGRAYLLAMLLKANLGLCITHPLTVRSSPSVSLSMRHGVLFLPALSPRLFHLRGSGLMRSSQPLLS